MRVNLKIANVAKETGALLTEYLEDRGLTIDKGAPISISYGIPSSQRCALNDKCGGGDKIKRLNQMQDGGCRTVPWFSGVKVPNGFQFPALARKISGHGAGQFMRQKISIMRENLLPNLRKRKRSH